MRTGAQRQRGVCVCGGALTVLAALATLLPADALLPLDAERLRASVGGFAVMNCHLDFPFGNEIPYHLQWDKDGESIFSWYSGDATPVVADRWGGRVRRVEPTVDIGAASLGRGSINVSAVRETDAGLYRCRVTFPNRTPPSRNDGVYYYLDVEGGNLIVTPPMNATVLEGNRAEIECLPKSPDYTVDWLKDGEPLDALPELAARVELAINGSLVLRHADSADAGYYECRVRAPEDADVAVGTQSAGAFLDVQYKAKVVYAPKERSLPYGKPASLDCHFSANPPLTNLRWEKDGFLFDPYNVPGVFYSRNGSLLFNKVDDSHEGDYSCTPYNALGTAGPSPRVRVRVLRAPSLAARPQPLYLARLGGALTLPCAPATESIPSLESPRLSWTRKDGSELPPGRHSLDGGNLTISDIEEEDAGWYMCTISNDAASATVETELRIENVPPRAPRGLSARATPHSIHLSWAPGVGGAEIDYDVWYRERAAPDWRTMRILTRGITEATLVGLRPATEYELRVLAQDHIGDGLFSRPLHVRTPDSGGEVTGETAFAAATTEVIVADVEQAEVQEELEGEPPGADELDVVVRLLDEGALVRWSREQPDSGRCTVRVYEDERLMKVVHTNHDYALVGSEVATEGARLAVRVRCGDVTGGAALRVPEYGRLRGVAVGAAVAALLLAALAAALYAARRRLCRERTPAPMTPYARPDKRLR